jgi:hypothetical protein
MESSVLLTKIVCNFVEIKFCLSFAYFLLIYQAESSNPVLQGSKMQHRSEEEQK